MFEHPYIKQTQNSSLSSLLADSRAVTNPSLLFSITENVSVS